MKQKTAVQLLAEQMMHPQVFNVFIEQALEIERQQIVDAYDKGYNDGLSRGSIDGKNFSPPYKYGKDYYN